MRRVLANGWRSHLACWLASLSVFAPVWPARADEHPRCDPITVDQALALARQVENAGNADTSVVPCISFETGTVPPHIQALIDQVERMQFQMKQPAIASADYDWTAHYRRDLERQRRVMQQIVIRIEMELEGSAKDCDKRLNAEAALAKYYSGPLREYHTAYAVYHRDDPGGFDSLRDLHVTGRTPEIAAVMHRLSGEWMGILDPLAMNQAEPVLRFNPLMEQKAETEAYAEAASYEPNYLKALSLRLITTELSNWSALDALRDDGGGRVPCLPRELIDRHISLRDPDRIVEHDRWLRTETNYRRTLPDDVQKALAGTPTFVTPEVIDRLKPHVPYWANFPSQQIATEIAKHEKALAPQVFRELIQASSVPLSALTPQARAERLASLAAEARATVTLRYIDYVYQAWKADNPVEARQTRLNAIMPQLKGYGGRLAPKLASLSDPQPFKPGADREGYVNAMVPVALAAAKIKEQQELVKAGLPMPTEQTITPGMAFVLQGKQLTKDFSIINDLTEQDKSDWEYGEYGRNKAKALVDILTGQKSFPETKAAWQELLRSTQHGAVRRQLLAIGQRVGLDGDSLPSLSRILLKPEDRSKLYEQQFNMTSDALPMVGQWVRWTETALGLDWLNPDTETRLYTLLKRISEDRKPIYTATRGRLVINRDTVAEYVTPGLVDQTVREMQQIVDTKLDEMFQKVLWRPIVGHHMALDPNSSTARVIQGAQRNGQSLFYALGGRIVVNRAIVDDYVPANEVDAVAMGLQQIADATVENLPVYLAPRGRLELSPDMQLAQLLSAQKLQDGAVIQLGRDNRITTDQIRALQLQADQQSGRSVRTIRLDRDNPMGALVRNLGTAQQPLIVQPKDGKLVIDTGELLRQLNDQPVYLGDRDAFPQLVTQPKTEYVPVLARDFLLPQITANRGRTIQVSPVLDPNRQPTAFNPFTPLDPFDRFGFRQTPITTYTVGGGLQLADRPLRVGPPVYKFEDLVNARGDAFDALDLQRRLEIPRAKERRESANEDRHVRRGGYPSYSPYGYAVAELPQYLMRQNEIRGAILDNDTDRLQSRLDAYWHDLNASWGVSAERQLAGLLEDLEYYAGQGGPNLDADTFNKLKARVARMKENWPKTVDGMIDSLDHQLKFVDDLAKKDSLASGFLGLSSTPVRSGPKRVLRQFASARREELPQRRTDLAKRGQEILNDIDRVMQQLADKPAYSSLNEAMMSELPISRIGETRAAMCRDIDQRCVASGLSDAEQGVEDADKAMQEETPELAAMHRDVQGALNEGAILSAVQEAMSDICKTLANTADMHDVEDMRKLLLAAEIRRALLQEHPVFVDIDKASEQELLNALNGGWKGKVALIIGAGFLILLIPGAGGAIVAVIGATAFHASIAAALVVSAGITVDNIAELESRKNFVLDLGTATHDGRRITNDAMLAAIEDELYGLRWDLDESWLPHIGQYWSLGMDVAFVGLEGMNAVKAFRLSRAARLAGAREEVEAIMRTPGLLERVGIVGKKLDDLTPEELGKLFEVWAKENHPKAFERFVETKKPAGRGAFPRAVAAFQTMETAKKGTDVARAQTLLRQIVDDVKPELIRGRSLQDLTPDDWDKVYRSFATKYHPDVAGRGISEAQKQRLLTQYADQIQVNAMSGKSDLAIAYEEHFKAGTEAFNLVEKSGGWSRFWTISPDYVPPHPLAPDPLVKKWWDYWRERAFGVQNGPTPQKPVALLPPPPGWLPKP